MCLHKFGQDGISVIYPAGGEGGVFVFVRVCLFVCLSVCLSVINFPEKTTVPIKMKFSG